MVKGAIIFYQEGDHLSEIGGRQFFCPPPFTRVPRVKFFEWTQFSDLQLPPAVNGDCSLIPLKYDQFLSCGPIDFVSVSLFFLLWNLMTSVGSVVFNYLKALFSYQRFSHYSK